MSEEENEFYKKRTFDNEKKYKQKYVTVDEARDPTKIRGDEFYISWFSDGLYELDQVWLDKYSTISDIKVASGKKVLNELLKDVGDIKVEELLKEGSIASETLKLTRDKERLNKLSEILKKTRL